MHFFQLRRLSLGPVPVMIESNIEPKKDRFIFGHSNMILKISPLQYDPLKFEEKKLLVWELKYISAK